MSNEKKFTQDDINSAYAAGRKAAMTDLIDFMIMVSKDNKQATKDQLITSMLAFKSALEIATKDKQD